jgi:uncharacterized membrane protein (UPF0182 family)
MRSPQDMPRSSRRRRLSGRGRIVLLVSLVALFVLVTSLSGIARIYTDYLWFDSLDLNSVWRTVLGAKAALAAIFISVFFLMMWVNLVLADKFAPGLRPAGPEEELLERYHDVVDRRAGLIRVVTSLVLAVVAGAGASSQWNDWILFTNRVDFGIKDQLFNTDIGFYVFQLPFLTFVVSWLFAALLIVLIVTAVAHYLNGGIRLQTQGERVSPQVKAHLSVLLGILALVKAGDYWLQRYELTLSTRGTVDGATYTDVNAQLPALYLLLMVALLSFVLFIINIRRRGWVLPVVTVGLWGVVTVLAGGVVPAVIQQFTVEPAESEKEEPYIDRNIEATRQAMGLDNVVEKAFDYNEDLSEEDLVANQDTLSNIRLLDPGVVGDTYNRLQAERSFYQFDDLDVDRYQIDGKTRQVVLGARELDPDGIPQQSWEGQHVAFTHGYGVALAPANALTSTGRPDFLVGSIPVTSEIEGIDKPQVYIGEDLDGYAVVGASRDEVDFQGQDGETESFRYDGDDGVGLSSFVKKAAFALRFQTPNFILSDFITDDSNIIFNRDIRGRVEALAPFLHWDDDPYPVVIDGRIVYILDGYTTSNMYPYGQRAESDSDRNSGLDHDFNYVRNSVKAVVDSYDGTVTMYQTAIDDPILDAYRGAFPDLFVDIDEMPDELQAHVRYPEDLFTIQTNMWTRYHIDGPQDFYEQTGGWEVAQDPGTAVRSATTDGATVAAAEGTASEETTAVRRQGRIDPYYLLMRLPDEDDEDFLILRSFVPISQDDERQELTAFMVAKSDPDDYGTLEVFEMPGTAVDGPAIVDSNIQSTEEIAREISLLNQQGSRVTLGNLLLIPIEQSILYVRPLYVEADSSTPIPELKNVIVAYGPNVVMRPTLPEALAALGPQFRTAASDVFDEDLEETEGDSADEPTTGDDPAEPPAGVEEVGELLTRADALFVEAEQALAEGDLGTYQDRVDEAQRLISQALALSAGSSAAPTTTTEPDAQGGEA